MKRLLVFVVAVVALAGLMAVPAFGADKLVVKDSGGINTVFVVRDDGTVGIGTATPGSQLNVVDNAGTSDFRGFITEQHNDGVPAAVFQFKRSRGTLLGPTALVNGDNIGAFHSWAHDGSAYLLTTSIITRVNGIVSSGSVPTDMLFLTGSSSASRAERMRILSNGNIGIGTNNPQYLLDVNGQIRVQTTVYSSSRKLKDNITTLNSTEAMEAFEKLTPVRFTYKNSPQVAHNGFIAEDVPDLVAQKSRDTIDPMDIVAVLTKVVQEQNKTIEALSAKIEKMERAFQGNKSL